MTLHPDILTDLVILYHAGEASQASRTLLEEEASRNPQLAAALAATSRPIVPLPAQSAADERKVLRKVRLRYQAISFAAVWMLAMVAIAFFPRIIGPWVGTDIVIAFLPLATLFLFFLAVVGSLYLLVRAIR